MATCENVRAGSYARCCGAPAVIRYDGKNLCAYCADENVLALYRHLKQLQDNAWWAWDEVDAALAKLAPEGGRMTNEEPNQQKWVGTEGGRMSTNEGHTAVLDAADPNELTSVVAAACRAGAAALRENETVRRENAELRSMLDAGSPDQQTEVDLRRESDSLRLQVKAREAERDEWMKIATDWTQAADAAQQPVEFYKDYNEGTMRAMQALLTRATVERDEARAECERLRAAIIEHVNTGLAMIESDLKKVVE